MKEVNRTSGSVSIGIAPFSTHPVSVAVSVSVFLNSVPAVPSNFKAASGHRGSCERAVRIFFSRH